MLALMLGLGAWFIFVMGHFFLRKFMITLGTIAALASMGLTIHGHLIWGIVYLLFGGSFFLATIGAISEPKKNPLIDSAPPEGEFASEEPDEMPTTLIGCVSYVLEDKSKEIS